MKTKLLITTIFLTNLVTTTSTKKQSPPVAAKKTHFIQAPHGDVRKDEYYWMRDDNRTNPEVLDYLEAENAYTEAVMKPLKSLQAKVFEEFISRVEQDDTSIPTRRYGYWYYTRYESGKNYVIYARRKGTMQAEEEILLNVNEMAEGKDFFVVGNYVITLDSEIMAWSEDDVGRNQYTIRFKNLMTGEIYKDEIKRVSANIVWASDNRTLLYVEKDPQTLRSKRVKRHVLGYPLKYDVDVYEEEDSTFSMGISRTRDDKFLMIRVSNSVSSEIRFAPANDPIKFVVLSPRKEDLKYSATHFAGHWVIQTDADGAKNYKIMTAPTNSTSWRDWRELIPHRSDVFIENFELFDDFTVISERSNALQRLRVLKKNGDDDYYIRADEPAYYMSLSANSEPNTDWLRYSYTSLTTPQITYEINIKTGVRNKLKQEQVAGYNSNNYITERVWVIARDGAKVPVSLVYKKGFEKNGKAPMLQYGYGSYGMSVLPYFKSSTISLLDRGFVYAIAHVRGGQEMGRDWYEWGKLLKKKNTFTDFIDVTMSLVKQGYAAKNRVCAYGGSAGGLLVGAISNMAPDHYRVILSRVPFVDVVTTMLDPTIPLTTFEYDEWGNPEREDYYEYMLSYSPYDNLRKQTYPAMFITTGLWDSQVQYWEPAKYVARLRGLNTSKNPVLLRINLNAGHGGKSGRYCSLVELAELYAFGLWQLGVKEKYVDEASGGPCTTCLLQACAEDVPSRANWILQRGFSSKMTLVEILTGLVYGNSLFYIYLLMIIPFKYI